jgi:hypothetical protein
MTASAAEMIKLTLIFGMPVFSFPAYCIATTHNVQLPHELLHGRDHNCRTRQIKVSVPKKLQGRALTDKVALIHNDLLGTLQA